jgi:hypothetical protein
LSDPKPDCDQQQQENKKNQQHEFNDTTPAFGL